jgi:Pilus formation protein N terminal region
VFNETSYEFLTLFRYALFTATDGGTRMTRSTHNPIASLAAVIAAIGFGTCDSALAGEPFSAGMKVISSDATDASTVQLGINKTIVIELPRDIKNVLIAGGQGAQAGQHPNPVNVAVLSRRRVSIIGVALGATNVYFYDAHDQQIGALIVYVAKIAQFYPPLLGNSSLEGGYPIQVVRGGNQDGFGSTKTEYLFCKPDLNDGCGYPAPSDEAVNTTHSDITINGGATPVVPVR